MALAAYSEGREQRRFIELARTASRSLSRSKAPYAPGLAHLLEAGIAVLRRQGREAVFHFKRAEAILESNQLVPWLVAARLALSEHLTGADKENTRAAAIEWMNSQKILKPERLAKMLFPAGFMER